MDRPWGLCMEVVWVWFSIIFVCACVRMLLKATIIPNSNEIQRESVPA